MKVIYLNEYVTCFLRVAHPSIHVNNSVAYDQGNNVTYLHKSLITLPDLYSRCIEFSLLYSIHANEFVLEELKKKEAEVRRLTDLRITLEKNLGKFRNQVFKKTQELTTLHK